MQMSNKYIHAVSKGYHRRENGKKEKKKREGGEEQGKGRFISRSIYHYRKTREIISGWLDLDQDYISS